MNCAIVIDVMNHTQGKHSTRTVNVLAHTDMTDTIRYNTIRSAQWARELTRRMHAGASPPKKEKQSRDNRFRPISDIVFKLNAEEKTRTGGRLFSSLFAVNCDF